MDKFIYIYSDIYQFHHEYVSKCLTRGDISYQAIKIDDISKERSSGHTFDGGVSIKIESLLKSIKNNIGNDIVFSDVTIGFNPKKIHLIKDYFNQYKKHDLCWQYNNSVGTGFNIGITKIKCNLKMLDFFNDVKDMIQKEKMWDQRACNDVYVARSPDIDFETFSDKLVADGSFALDNIQVRENFYIWKQLIAQQDRTPEEIVSIRTQQLKNHRLLI